MPYMKQGIVLRVEYSLPYGWQNQCDGTTGNCYYITEVWIAIPAMSSHFATQR